MAFIRMLAVLSFLFPAVSFGWGQNGHRVVGHIAEQHLTEKAKSALSEIMGRESLARASTWPDEIKSHPDRKTYGRYSYWHYVNIADGQKYDPKSASSDGDIIQALDLMEKQLKDSKSSMDQKKFAVRFLAHLIGDAHQPLHVGTAEDHGGNWCYVKWFTDRQVNLHSVWDTELIEFLRLSYTELATYLDIATEDQIIKWQASSYMDWIYESMDLRDSVYEGDRTRYCKMGSTDRIREDMMPDLGYDYQYKHARTIESRLLQAGIRLAGVLNSAFE